MPDRSVTGSSSPESPLDTPTYVRLPRELHQAVMERSKQEERTMAQTVRLALRLYLQDHAGAAS